MSEELKARVGEAVCETLRPGMRLGIGTGSTAEAFVHALSKRVKDGLDIIGVPTSERTARLCEQLGIKLTTLDETPQLDLTIDGADEVDLNLNLIKGGGGALLREKIVAAASHSMYVIADDSKMVDRLGAYDLPIEVNIFGLAATKIAISNLAVDMGLPDKIRLRCIDNDESKPFVSDGGHYIFDASFGLIPNAVDLNAKLLAIPGVVQHGLFINMAVKVFIAGENGVKILERN